MKTEMKELELNELEQANGGYWFALAIIAIGAAAGVVHGLLSDSDQ